MNSHINHLSDDMLGTYRIPNISKLADKMDDLYKTVSLSLLGFKHRREI
jgi:hypothetical protein